MEHKKTKVLLIEHSQKDVDAIESLLGNGKSQYFELDHTDKLDNGLQLLEQGQFDVVLLDLSVSQSKDLEALDQIHSKHPLLPIVVLTDKNNQVTALKAVESGAQDYFLKDTNDPIFLTSSLKYSLKRKQVQMIKEEFTGTIAHEINTPMAIIREGISQVLDGLNGDLNEEQQRQLTIALKNVDWVRRIIDDLLGKS